MLLVIFYLSTWSMLNDNIMDH